MGGDHAPRVTVDAALAATERGVEVVLVGQSQVLAAELERAGAAGALTVVDAPDVVGMDEDPAVAVRGKPRSSVRVAAELVAAGEAGALVSAGSTGATLAAALLTIGRIPGVRRPVVGAVIPAGDGPGVVLADAGGSADAQPETVAAYARMAAAYSQALGVASPRIGLLNVGAEPGKGNAQTKAVYDLLAGTTGFAGNVEPDVVLRGEVDAVIADGFTGNIFLKTVEALGTHEDRDTAAVVLGIAGEVLIAHGAADADELARALSSAAAVAEAGLSQRVGERLAD